MSFIMRMYCRFYHFCLKFALYIYPMPRPQVFNSRELDNWCGLLIQKRIQRVLLVTDEGICQLALHQKIVDLLEQKNIQVTLFSSITPDPDIQQIELGFEQYLTHQCQAVIALGGGSVIDGAKLICVRVARPKISLKKLKGLFKVMRRLPILTAIPTTAGTGSETTVAAVVSDKKTKSKFAIADYCLMPNYAVMMPELTTGLPKQLTVTTALDALTHAVEAYIGINGSAFTDKQALKACKLILTYLPIVMERPNDLNAREQLLFASFYAGEAFTRTSVGYVHAIAHQLGAQYRVPHGLANSVLLDVVLKEYGAIIEHKLAEIDDYVFGFENPLNRVSDRALRVITAIENIKLLGEIACNFEVINECDVDKLAEHAFNEAHPDYPVPAFWSKQRIAKVIRKVKA